MTAVLAYPLFTLNNISQNKDLDKFANKKLRKAGWNVVRVWEHELKSPLKIVAKLKKHLP